MKNDFRRRDFLSAVSAAGFGALVSSTREAWGLDAIANPLASILSFGMCLTHSLDAPAASDLLVRSIRLVLARGVRTADIASAGERSVPGAAMTDAVLAALDELAVDLQQALQS